MAAPEAWHVTRTMRTIELLAVQPRSALEVADALGVHVRTARRLLNRLVVEGYVARAGARRRDFALTLKLLSVGEYAFEPTPLVREAVPVLAELSAATGLSAHLSVSSFRSALPIADEHGPGIGRRLPCHACAPGKALLAYRPAWRDAVLAYPLEPHTDATVVAVPALLDELTVVRDHGHATERDELHPGLSGVAAPVADHTGTVVAALGLEGPTATLAPVLEDLTGVVASAATRLSTTLGHRASAPAPAPEPPADLLALVPAARSYAA